ncbi:restriction endonuclease subunit S [uncultured Clostridium sp.]|uniref:restriction endonuclease subunit S n=1 Tax=uncultured Clostridium sp. TaxID=59620 RepID=UPI002585BCC6|nr:restriction endonuclease subunit S [uncultured Clostridium sp.]
MANKPRIRFRGFTEDWEQRKLGDVAIITGGGTPSTNVPEYWNGDIDWYSPVEIGKNRYVSKSTRKITKLGLEKSSAKLLPIGTVLFTSRAGIGNTAILQAEGCTNQGFQSITPDSKELDTYFLYTMTPRLKRYGEVTGAGSTFVEVSGKQMEKMSLVLPSLEEQKQIGRFFRTIDDSITLHQCKLKKLNLAKKSLLQKLFPRNGSQIPGVRFKGFTDAWEQRKFSDITYLSGIKNKENKPYESYSISNEFGFIPQDEQFENGGTMKTADKSMYYIVSQNSFAYNPARINVGSIGYYDKPNNVIVSSLYEVFKTTDIVNDKFLWHWFKSNQFNRLIEKYQEGGVRLYFYYDKLCKGTIDLPTINEQNKISNLLYSLDLYITLHQRKLERLQEVKKGLLQKMFV